MRLNAFTIRAFQSYADEQTIVFDEHLTLLAGRNNVGKSALLRALQLLARPQEGAGPDTALSWDWTVDVDSIRAVFPNIGDQQGHTNQQVLDWLLADEPSAIRIQADYVVTKDSPHVGPDQLSLARLELVERRVGAFGKAGTALGWNDGPFKGGSTGVGQLEALLRSWAARHVVYLGPRRVEQGSRHLSLQTTLDPDARNLTDVLLYLQTNQLETFDRVRETLTRAFPDVVRLSVRQDESDNSSGIRGEPVLYFQGRPDPIPLRFCGTGIEQMLALATGVLSAQQPRVFLIDEPQAYLHPHAERSLLQLLEEHPEHQYVVASHSNVLLRARPLTNVRMLYLDGGQTRIVGDPEGEQLLTELEITAADLWLVDRLLWVEGPTEEEVLTQVADAVLEPRKRVTLTVRRMPEAASRFATKNKSAAEAAYRFCAETSKAVAPLPIRMLFLFDADEKRPEFRERMEEASDGRARFLPVRELENLFLDARLLEQALNEFSDHLELERPAEGAIPAQLGQLLQQAADLDLFPDGVRNGEEAIAVVRGSRLLDALWWEFVTAKYDKVRDGRALARIAIETNPGLLQPLVDTLKQLTKDDD